MFRRIFDTRTTLTLALALASLAEVGCSAKFKAVEAPVPGNTIARRAKLDNFATYADHPESLVGHLLFVKAGPNGQCSENRVYDVDHMSLNAYLQTGKQPEPKTKSEIVYQGAQKGGANINPVIASFSGKISGATASEMIVTDVRQVVGDDVIDSTAIAALEATPLDPGICKRILIKNVVVSLVQVKTYQAASSSLNFTGTAFGVGSDIYEQKDVFQPEFILGMDIYQLKSPGSNPPPNVPSAPAPDDGVPVTFRVPANGFPSH